MTKKLILGTMLLSISIGAYAAPITPEEALARISGSAMKAPAAKAPRLVHTARTGAGQAAVYVFNRPDDGGYLLLSADDRAYPMLGYADEGCFSADNIPPAMQWWMEEYGRQIEYAASHDVTSSAFDPQKAVLEASRASRQPIPPMIATEWDQGEPYNDLCPKDGVTPTYTGCVATAMAQVMNYWKYPEKGRGKITYTMETLQKKYTLNLDLRKFDWANMLDIYTPGQYNEAQAEAVAYLMKACGFAVKMDYGTDSSGALAMLIRQGMVKYFGYDPNAFYTLRMYYSSTQWEEMVYDNLRNVGPILYGGASEIGGGHSFVCDGYDGNGYFHFNWGWTGMSNGYFSLDALNPGALGSGGGDGGGYNFTQDAVFGIQPPTGKPVQPQPEAISQMGSLIGSIENSELKFDLDVQQGAMWVNYNPVTLRIKFGARFEPQGTTPGTTLYCDISERRWEIQPGYGTSPAMMKPSVSLPSVGLADGTYKVSLATLALEETDPSWVPVKTLYGYYDYVMLTKKGDTYTVENYYAPQLKVLNGGIEGAFYYGCTSRIWLEVENPSDIELTGGFAPLFADSEALAYLGESVLVTVPPHTKKTITWNTQLYGLRNNMQAPSKMTLLEMTFMDEGSYKIYNEDLISPVYLFPNPGAPSVSLTASPVVAGCSHSTQTIDGQNVEIYEVQNPGKIEVSATLRLNSGYFAYPVLACLCQSSETNPGMVEILTYSSTTVFMDNTESPKATVNTFISYPQAEPGKTYTLAIAYGYGSEMKAINGGNPVFLRMSRSGVEDIAVADALDLTYDRATQTLTATSETGVSSIEVYSVTGTLLASSATATLSLENIPAGMVIATARDRMGHVRTLKIVR